MHLQCLIYAMSAIPFLEAGLEKICKIAECFNFRCAVFQSKEGLGVFGMEIRQFSFAHALLVYSHCNDKQNSRNIK